MELVFYLSEAAAAGILSVDNLIIWASFLVAAKATVSMLLWKQSQSQTKSVPVRANTHRLVRRAAARSPWH
ncbi:MAG: hypothetical protein AB7O13_20930 [Alphaproteobacteria bacterium]